MQTCRSNTRRAARSLLAENEVTQTRSQAPVRRSTALSGSTAGASFRSMLNRTSGQAPSRSSSTGIGSVPSISAAATSRCLILATRPGRPVTRARERSWKAMRTPSSVAWTSVSRYPYPSPTACSKARHEFSGACAAPPRWANAIGVGWSRNAVGM